MPKAHQSWSRPQEITTIQVIASEPEKKSFFAPVNDVKYKKLVWLEAKALIEASGENETESTLTVVEELRTYISM